MSSKKSKINPESDQALDGALDRILTVANEAEIEMPSREDLEKLQDVLNHLKGTKRWQQVADMTRQPIERYLTDNELPLTLTPILAGILAREGEPWALVQLRILMKAGSKL